MTERWKHLEGVLVPLASGEFALVDEADADRVLAHSWHAHRNGERVYATRREGANRKSKLLHRFVMSARPGELIDHRDGDGLNNTRSNLRSATSRQNAANGRAYGEVPFRGVRCVA